MARTKTEHQHEAATTGPDYCYSGRVADAGPAAGNIEHQEMCRCGALRWAAVNQQHAGYGEWTEPSYAVVEKSDNGHTHTVVETDLSLRDAWRQIDGDGSWARGVRYVTQTQRQAGDRLPSGEMTMVPRPSEAQS